MTKRLPVIMRNTRRGPSRAALEARNAAAQAWAEVVIGQAMQDLERKGAGATLDGLRALVRVVAEQIGRATTPTLAGCVLFGEGAKLAPGWRPDIDSINAIAEAAFKSSEAA